MSPVSAPPLDWPEAPPLTPAALLALRELVHPHEMAYRRARLKGARRFFGLDLHREYLVAYAVDEALTPVVRPTTLPWDRFPAWRAKTLCHSDAVAIEMTTNTWATHDELAPHVHSVTVRPARRWPAFWRQASCAQSGCPSPSTASGAAWWPSAKTAWCA